MAATRQARSSVHPASPCSSHHIPADPDDDQDEPRTAAGSNAVHDDGVSGSDLHHVLQLPVSTSAVLVL
ncbi:hypothetical protein D3C85_1383670 [compost metagenome]